MRSPALSLLVFASMSAAAGLTAGCQNRSELASWSRAALTQIAPQQTQTPAQVAPQQAAAPQQAPASQPVQANPAPGHLGERPLDLGPSPVIVAPPPAPPPVLVANNLHRKVRTVSDEKLPSWVPVSGRLTVVESSDLAENLGLVPTGTTRKTDERISVAEKLADENASRSAANAATRSDPMTRGSSWSFSAGRVKNHRF